MPVPVLFALAGLFAVAAVWFLWARKLGKPAEQAPQTPAQPQ